MDMDTCAVCGNEYKQSLEGETCVFGNFEYKIQTLSPNCAHCGCQVSGHEMENAGFFSAVLVAPSGITSLAHKGVFANPSQLQVERSVQWLRESA